MLWFDVFLRKIYDFQVSVLIDMPMQSVKVLKQIP